MDQCFSVETKAFSFSENEGLSEFLLEERRKGFVVVILVANQGAAWLVATVEEVVQSPVTDEYVKSFHEEQKALMVRGSGSGNKAGRFLEVVVYAKGGQKGIWIQEGCRGWGWRRFAGPLRQMLAIQVSKAGFSKSEVPFLAGKQIQVNQSVSSTGFKAGRSFVEVLQSSSGVVAEAIGMKILSSRFLGLFQVSTCFEMGKDGMESRLLVDCYELESSNTLIQRCLPSPLVAAAATMSRKKMKGILGKQGVKKWLGQICSELDWILGGLVLKPKGKWNRAGIMGHAGSNCGLNQRLDPRLDASSVTGLDLAPDPASKLDLEPDLESRTDLGSIPASVSVPDHDSGHDLETNRSPGGLLVSAFASPKANRSNQVMVTDALVSVPLSSMLSSGQVFLLENFAANFVGALALGERLCISMGDGVPIYEQTLRYYRRAKKERGVWVKDSLLCIKGCTRSGI
jgi:hypothetical protein